MYVFRLEHLQFNDGSELNPGNLTIICGPNNVGKSRLLKDITLLASHHSLPWLVIVRTARFSFPESLDELRSAYNVERRRDERGNWSYRSLTPELCSEQRSTGGWVWPDGYHSMFQRRNDATSQKIFATTFGASMVAHLTTEHRLQLVKQSSSASDADEIANLLQALYTGGPKAEKRVRDEVERAFGCQVALDYTSPRTLLLRVGEDFSAVPPDPREAKPVLLEFGKLDEQGDGLRAFVGIVVSALVLNRGLFLIDEPEAFLHPPQAFRIGEFLASEATDSRQFVIATHSVDFLRGVLSRTQDVTVLRVDRTGDNNAFLQLKPKTLENLATDPLLSSARVLDGLFYAGAVVVEADRDARFYHSVFKKRFPETDLHFVNADNKQTVPKLIKLYRDLGVKACGVVDFDVLRDASEFDQTLRTLGVANSDRELALNIRAAIGSEAKEAPIAQQFDEVTNKVASLSAEISEHRDDPLQRAKFLASLEAKCRDIAQSAKGWKELKLKGVDALSEPMQKQFAKLYDLCASNGLLITPTGELESMLISYGIERTTDKRGWILRALKLVPSLDPDDAKYPWKLVKSLKDNLKI
jgi:predicted ATPase